MRLLFLNHIQNAHQSMRSTKMRTALTMLGITIGIGCITFVLAISGGAMNIISKQVVSLDKNIGIIRPGNETPNKQKLAAITSPTHQSYAVSSITEQDLDSLSTIKHLKSAAPLMLFDARLTYTDTTLDNQQVVATNENLADIANLNMKDGQFIDDTTDEKTAVVGSQMAIDLFGTSNVLGQLFTMHQQDYRIIGILKPTNNPINFNMVDFDNAMIVKLQAGKSYHSGVAQIQQIDFQADKPEHLPAVASEIKKTITRNHQGVTDFHITHGEDIAAPSSQLFNAVAIVSAAIASVSLIVGGIGIMNIMLVNVAERTREIGIRKALGASNAHIVGQFLFESLAISIGGGVGGYALGYIGALAISVSLPFTPLFNWEIALIALGVSVTIGTIFGLYPAIRAARKDPIESLRFYN